MQGLQEDVGAGGLHEEVGGCLWLTGVLSGLQLQRSVAALGGGAG